MISCILQGGLGNQLFQVAAAQSLALEINEDFALNHDLCYTPNQGNKSKKYKNSFFKEIKETQTFPTIIYQEKEYSYNEIPKKKGLTIHGYFQSEKYFIKNKNEIIKSFTLEKKYFDEIEEWKKYQKIKNQTVGVHIRRGDYLKFSHYHLILDIEYYKKCFQNFINVDFIIVSDDIEWVKENIKGDSIKYFCFNDEIKDFILISSCNHNIIANSSFSWWAAYLNKNPDKQIYAPKNWFTEQANCNTKDLIPEKWIKI